MFFICSLLVIFAKKIYHFKLFIKNCFCFQYLKLINSYLACLLKNYLMSILLILFFYSCFSFQKIEPAVILARFLSMQIY